MEELHSGMPAIACVYSKRAHETNFARGRGRSFALFCPEGKEPEMGHWISLGIAVSRIKIANHDMLYNSLDREDISWLVEKNLREQQDFCARHLLSGTVYSSSGREQRELFEGAQFAIDYVGFRKARRTKWQENIRKICPRTASVVVPDVNVIDNKRRNIEVILYTGNSRDAFHGDNGKAFAESLTHAFM